MPAVPGLVKITQTTVAKQVHLVYGDPGENQPDPGVGGVGGDGLGCVQRLGR